MKQFIALILALRLGAIFAYRNQVIRVSAMRVLPTIFVFLLGANVSAQDWILLKTNDTIYCKIISVDELSIVYKMISSEPESSVPRELVTMYHKAEFKLERVILPIPNDIPPPPPIKGARAINREKGLELGLCAGYTYRLAGAPEGSSNKVKEHIRKLKSGFNIKAEAVYFFGRFFGLGAKYTFSHAHATTDDVSGYSINGWPYRGEAYDNINIHFVGIHPTSRVSTKNGSVRFLPGITFGYLAVLSRSNFDRSFKLSGGTFGFSVDLSLEFKVVDGLYLGIDADLAVGTIKKYKIDDGIRQGTLTYDSGGDNLSRIDASGGFRYYFQ